MGGPFGHFPRRTSGKPKPYDSESRIWQRSERPRQVKDFAGIAFSERRLSIIPIAQNCKRATYREMADYLRRASSSVPFIMI